ncbi:MAG TPA: asparagine synthase (glutamine-hydrolyzing) [Pyrinomonadaceae bacterium]|nr:asparagine synthase (glutamine-hydrolyzing) [Pyrinomonadaceae bacterium]
MCGINGIAFSSRSGRTVDSFLIERMRDTIRHRGPDDEGMFIAGPVGLGHRRLSIVDVSAGHQPMTNEDGSLQITYNGEIYNHSDFRAELEARGHIYKTHCDTETILHLYEEHGAGCVEHLRGMFAFALWDGRQKKLLLARDRLGIKPLYYALTNDGSLFFASEMKAILAVWGRKPELNFNVLPDYLANHAPSGEETMFRGIRRLPPGHTLTWKDGSVDVLRFWDVQFSPADESGRSDDSYVEEWTELFRTSVRLRLMADVPLGMFLSGGIDSSAIAAMMSQMVSEPIKTFSVAFKEREANELEYARLVARKFNTDHHEIVVSPDEFFKALPKLTWHEDEPIAHLASIPLYFVSSLARDHVKVVLTGEGSDEMLAGYARYRKTIYNIGLGTHYQKLPGVVRNQLKRTLERLPASSKVRQKLSRTFLTLSPDIDSIYFDNFAVFTRARQAALLSDQAKEQIVDTDPYREMHRYLDQTDAESLLNQLLYVDTKAYLHELLMKQDQMSMAASIESRVPFLDHKLVEFTARLPDRLKLRGWTTKYVLRRSMKDVLPPEIISRSKMGFPVPLGSWLRERYRSVVDEYVLGERALARNIFNRQTVERLVTEHHEGTSNHADRLWALITFEVWMRQFIDDEKGESDPVEMVPVLAEASY